MAIGVAIEAVHDEAAGSVPVHLRDTSYQGAKALGHGEGYRYPHDAPTSWVDQQYLPDEHRGRRFYEPGDHGDESTLVDRWRARRGRERGHTMTASDVVLVALAVLVAIGAGATVSMLVSLRSTLVSLRASLDSLQHDTLPIVEELRDAVDHHHGSCGTGRPSDHGRRVSGSPRRRGLAARLPHHLEPGGEDGCVRQWRQEGHAAPAPLAWRQRFAVRDCESAPPPAGVVAMFKRVRWTAVGYVAGLGTSYAVAREGAARDPKAGATTREP